MKVNGFYPYIFYSVKPDLSIFTDSSLIGKIASINYMRASTEIRLFPHGVATIHLRVYIKTPLAVQETVALERAFLNQEIFHLNEKGAEKLGLQKEKNYTLQTLFEAIANRLWKALYIGEREPIDNRSLDYHTIIFMKASEGTELSDDEIAQIMTHSNKEPKFKEIEDYKKQRLQTDELLEIKDVIAFGHGATLLFMSKGDPATSGCFRTNYSNVVEFSLIQNFLLTTFVDHIRNEWQRTDSQLPYLGKLNGGTMDAIRLGLAQYPKCLKGGHGKLYKLINKIRKYDLLEENFNKMSFDEYWAGREVIGQLASAQQTLKSISEHISSDNTLAKMLLPATLGAVDALYGKGKTIEDGLNDTLQELNRVRNDPIGTDEEKILRLKRVISNYRRDYEDNYFSYFQKVVEELLQNKEKITNVADQMREEGKKVPEKEKVGELMQTATVEMNKAKDAKAKLGVGETDSPKAFIDKALPYIEGIAKAAGAVLKAIGWLPL
jgi:hypothetical protein